MVEMNETWRPVYGHEHCEVSNLGRVRSWKGRGRSKKLRAEPVIRRSFQDAQGYLRICFSKAGKRVNEYVARLVWQAFNGPVPLDMMIDHINRDPVDNRLENLRLATRSQNLYNGGSKGGSSKYKGVSYTHRLARWRVMINAKGVGYYLGCFSNEHVAALMYNFAAKRLHGEFARLNEVNLK